MTLKIPEIAFSTLTNNHHSTFKEIFWNFEHPVFDKTILKLYLAI